MKAEIIAVGTEILLGDIVNSNSQYLASELASFGIDMYYQQVVGDNEQRLMHAFDEAYKRSDIIITTGGLGPTNDDITKEVAAKYFNIKLIKNDEAEQRIRKYFESTNRNMPDNNLKQAYVPEGSIVIQNDNGTAPGVIIEKDNKVMIILPGPPKEMKPMFDDKIASYLQKKSNSIIVSKMIKIAGIGESSVADRIKDLLDSQTNPTIAPYAKDTGVVLRVTAKAENKEKALSLIKPMEEELKSRFGESIFTTEDEPIENVVAKMLIEKNLTISTAESCTGGMIASALINYPGVSKVFLEGAVTYTNEAKHKRLGVKEETLKKYTEVSAETAKEMAEGIANNAGTDTSIVTTGIAGPGGGTKDKPVGLVYIGVYVKGKTIVEKHIFNGNRAKVRLRATVTGLDMLRREILKLK